MSSLTIHKDMTHIIHKHNFITSISVEILLHGSNQCKFTVNKQLCDAVHIFIKKNSKRL